MVEEVFHSDWEVDGIWAGFGATRIHSQNGLDLVFGFPDWMS